MSSCFTLCVPRVKGVSRLCGCTSYPAEVSHVGMVVHESPMQRSPGSRQVAAQFCHLERHRQWVSGRAAPRLTLKVAPSRLVFQMMDCIVVQWNPATHSTWVHSLLPFKMCFMTSRRKGRHSWPFRREFICAAGRHSSHAGPSSLGSSSWCEMKEAGVAVGSLKGMQCRDTSWPQNRPLWYQICPDLPWQFSCEWESSPSLTEDEPLHWE